MDEQMNRSLSPAAIFNALQGDWHLTRTIAGFGRMTGAARFCAASADTLHYHEAVEVTRDNGNTNQGYRDYVYHLKDNEIEVSFTDGKPFHRLEFTAGGAWPRRATGHHGCAADIYEASYRFKGPNAFSVRWTVKGPRKDYVAQTRYLRLAHR